jgi:hypothetical protein
MPLVEMVAGELKNFFAQVGFKPRSSRSPPPKYLGV